jgi:hypothetical protein
MNTSRIKINQQENETSISIFPIKNVLKSRLLLAWLIIWTLCGIIVFSQFFSNMSKEEKLAMAIWMAFWVYFEYKISTAFAWRKNGFEKIRVTNELLIYSKLIGSKETKTEYLLDNISDLQVYEFGKNHFSDSFQSSYWVQGNECIFFSYFGVKKGMGLQLSKEEANQVFQSINKKLKKRK